MSVLRWMCGFLFEGQQEKYGRLGVIGTGTSQLVNSEE